MTQWQPEEDDLLVTFCGLSAMRPAVLTLEWTPEGGRRRVGRPKKTWQDKLKEDLEMMGVN